MIVTFDEEILDAMDKLGRNFPHLKWDFSPDKRLGTSDLVSHFLGDQHEDVMVNLFKGKSLSEDFHRQDFFFLHFAFHGEYETRNEKNNRSILVHEGDCYIGQPYSGYAAKVASKKDTIIIGILIRQEAFLKEFLSNFSSDTTMLTFFLEPEKNKFSDEFLHFPIPKESLIWRLLGILILEYARKTSDTQKIIKPLVASLCMAVSSEYKQLKLPKKLSLAESIEAYIDSNSDTATLSSTASHFGYHPVYISKLLPERTGLTFSQLLTRSRMNRAEILLSRTDFSIEVIASMLGYGNNSNFYKAYKKYYGHSPRKKDMKKTGNSL